MNQSKSKVSKLVETIFQNASTYERIYPTVPDDQAIQRELSSRETLDQNMRLERQNTLDQMFPNRTQGLLYETVPETQFDF